MNLSKLYNISTPFFSHQEIANVLNISLTSASVAAHRYIQKGLILRIKPNIYVFTERWRHFSLGERFEAANYMQVPSCISLTTALEYYGITTQIQRNYIESIGMKRTLQKEIGDYEFRFYKIKTDLYTAFEKKEQFYIAIPEKAFLDAFYLWSFGRYAFDLSAIDNSRFNQELMNKLSENFPEQTQKRLRRYGFIT